MSLLHANQAVRLGLRAATRNPELAFGKALVDIGGAALSILPVASAALLISGVLATGDLAALLRSAMALKWTTIGALATVEVLSFTATAAFWSGALPLLAADAEMDARPPAGNFARLAGLGFARVTATSALAWALSLVHALASTAAIFAGAVAFVEARSPAMAALFALAIVVIIAGGLGLDLLARLMLVRSAALGEDPIAAFAGAARLLAGRLGALALITLAFAVLELVAATALSALGGALTSALLSGDARAMVLSMAPRAAFFIAAAAIYAWLELGRYGALAAIAANDAGLLEPPPPPTPRGPVPAVLQRPEQVIEAEPVIEALPAPEKKE